MEPITLKELKDLQALFAARYNNGLTGIQSDSVHVQYPSDFRRLAGDNEIVNDGVNGNWIHFHTVVDGLKIIYLAPISEFVPKCSFLESGEFVSPDIQDEDDSRLSNR
jgi:hypothetical protein